MAYEDTVELLSNSDPDEEAYEPSVLATDQQPWPLSKAGRFDFLSTGRAKSLAFVFAFAALVVLSLAFHQYSNNRQTDGPEVWVVTAVSGNHYGQLRRWICDLQMFKGKVPGLRIAVFDLGLDSRQRQLLKSLEKRDFIDRYHELDFTLYPDWWNMTVAAGEYAWKPEIVALVAADIKSGHLLWMDAGNSFTDMTLKDMITKSETNGFTSDQSTGPGSAQTWIYPAMIDYFRQESHFECQDWQSYAMCDGAVMGYQLPTALPLIKAWQDCAHERACIAPLGSSRANHRQDQSSITILAHELGYGGCVPSHYTELKIHQDDVPFDMGYEHYRSGVCDWEFAYHL